MEIPSEEDVLDGRMVLPLAREGGPPLSDRTGVANRFLGIFIVDTSVCIEEFKERAGEDDLALSGMEFPVSCLAIVDLGGKPLVTGFTFERDGRSRTSICCRNFSTCPTATATFCYH